MSELVECPFNSSHIVRKSRLPYHICKCRENYRSSQGPRLKACPFNAKHVLPESFLEEHLLTCADRMQWSKEYSIEKQVPQLRGATSKATSSLSHKAPPQRPPSSSSSSSTRTLPSSSSSSLRRLPPPSSSSASQSHTASSNRMSSLIPQLPHKNMGTYEWDDDDE